MRCAVQLADVQAKLFWQGWVQQAMKTVRSESSASKVHWKCMLKARFLCCSWKS